MISLDKTCLFKMHRQKSHIF